MTSIDEYISYEQFKVLVSDFLKRCKASPVPTEAQLENGLKMIRIGYIQMNEDMWRDSAFIAIQLAEKEAAKITGNLL